MDKLVSKQCIDYIKGIEGFYSKAYICPAGVPTIGYGTTNPKYVKRGTCTKEEATLWLEEELNEKAAAIKRNLDSIKYALKQNEFDALASMAYNIGTGGLLGSKLYKNVTQGIRDKKIITESFQAWSKITKNVDGKKVMETSPGLLRRRTEEAAMFLNGEVTPPKQQGVNYVLEYQKWFNKVTQTSKPISEDGVYGAQTLNALNKMELLIKGGK